MRIKITDKKATVGSQVFGSVFKLMSTNEIYVRIAEGAASVTGGRADTVLCLNLTSFTLHFIESNFDCIPYESLLTLEPRFERFEAGLGAHTAER